MGTQQKEAGDSWVGLPLADTAVVRSIMEGTGIAAGRARTVLASNVHFLNAIDPALSAALILPAFDWRTVTDPIAAQMWDGYLHGGRWNDRLFEALRPALGETYRKIGVELPHRRRELATRLAGVAVFSATNPIENSGWLIEFVTSADDDLRAEFAAGMGRFLLELDDGARKLVWDRWLREFWQGRTYGSPSTIGPREGAEMLGWVFGLIPVIQEVIPLAERTPLGGHLNTHILSRLHDSKILEMAPEQMSIFLAVLLRRTERIPPWELRTAEGVTAQLIELLPLSSPTALREVCERLAQLGSPRAIELEGRLPAR
jgi:hypothetical protein